MRAFSSAGSEHLPYKQRVGGSNPSTPTTENQGVTIKVTPFFVALKSIGLIQKSVQDLNRELNIRRMILLLTGGCASLNHRIAHQNINAPERCYFYDNKPEKHIISQYILHYFGENAPTITFFD